MRFSFVLAAVLSLSGLFSVTGLSAAPPGVLLGEYFLQDPLVDSRTVVSGDALSRLTWNHDRPVWQGDRPGSLTALYDSTMAPGLFGFPLPDDLDQTEAFTAAAILVIDSDEFQADPQGFFQIAWGVWNSSTTGLERTGNFTDYAGDTFDLLSLNTDGFSSFSITEIDATEAFDPIDPLDFVTGLGFVSLRLSGRRIGISGDLFAVDRKKLVDLCDGCRRKQPASIIHPFQFNRRNIDTGRKAI